MRRKNNNEKVYDARKVFISDIKGSIGHIKSMTVNDGASSIRVVNYVSHKPSRVIPFVLIGGVETDNKSSPEARHSIRSLSFSGCET